MSLAAAQDTYHQLSEADVIAFVLVDLAVIVAAARALGWVLVKLNQPRVIGEILAGIALGPTLLGGSAPTSEDEAGSGLVGELFPFEAVQFLDLLAALALVLFMFLVGLEVEQRFFRGHGRQIVVLGLAVTVIPFVIGLGVATVLDEPGVWRAIVDGDGDEVAFVTHALFIGAGLAVTAFPVMARILQEKGRLATEMGAVAIGAAAVSLPLMFIIVASAFATGPHGVPESVLLKLLLTLALAAFLMFAVRPLLGWMLTRRFTPDGELDGDVFAVLLIGAFLSGAAAEWIGVEGLTGGFLFGAAVPQVPGLARAVVARLEDLVVIILIPVLLTVAGLKTNLRDFGLDELGGLALFLAAMIVAKWGVGAVTGRGVGLSWSDANSVGVLMNCRGLEILIVGLIGLQADVLTEEMMAVFVVGAIVTTLMTGPLFDRFAGRTPAPPEPAAVTEHALDLAELGEEIDGGT